MVGMNLVLSLTVLRAAALTVPAPDSHGPLPSVHSMLRQPLGAYDPEQELRMTSVRAHLAGAVAPRPAQPVMADPLLSPERHLPPPFKASADPATESVGEDPVSELPPPFDAESAAAAPPPTRQPGPGVTQSDWPAEDLPPYAEQLAAIDELKHALEKLHLRDGGPAHAAAPTAAPVQAPEPKPWKPTAAPVQGDVPEAPVMKPWGPVSRVAPAYKKVVSTAHGQAAYRRRLAYRRRQAYRRRLAYRRRINGARLPPKKPNGTAEGTAEGIPGGAETSLALPKLPEWAEEEKRQNDPLDPPPPAEEGEPSQAQLEGEEDIADKAKAVTQILHQPAQQVKQLRLPKLPWKESLPEDTPPLPDLSWASLMSPDSQELPSQETSPLPDMAWAASALSNPLYARAPPLPDLSRAASGQPSAEPTDLEPLPEQTPPLPDLSRAASVQPAAEPMLPEPLPEQTPLPDLSRAAYAQPAAEPMLPEPLPEQTPLPYVSRAAYAQPAAGPPLPEPPAQESMPQEAPALVDPMPEPEAPGLRGDEDGLAGSVSKQSFDEDEGDSFPMPVPPESSILHAMTCSGKEQTYLMQVQDTEDKYKGKVLTNGTWKPRLEPGPCRGRQPNLVSCYYSWGFSKTIAQCYAREEVSVRVDCRVCMYQGAASPACHTCIGNLARIRRQCVGLDIGISPTCQECHETAHNYWDEQCAVRCHGVLKHPEEEGTYACRSCGDRFYGLLKTCQSR